MLGATAILSVGILGACQADGDEDVDVDIMEPTENFDPGTGGDEDPGTTPSPDVDSEINPNPDVDVDVNEPADEGSEETPPADDSAS